MDAESLQIRTRNNGRPRVIIIGAGISGITAANALSKAGFTDFAVLEATDRIGGRIHSIDIGVGHKIEIGANWIHGIDANPIFKIATQNNLLSTQYEGRNLGKKMIFLTETGDPVHPRIVTDVDLNYGMLINECEIFYKEQIPTLMDDDSVGGYVEREFEDRISRFRGEELRLRRMVFAQRLLGESIISGADTMFDVSLSEAGCFEDLPGVHYVIPPGFETIVHILKQEVPDDKIFLNHTVTHVNWNVANQDSTYSVCVECTDGRKFYGDVCLVTISLGYLKQHAERIFSPTLPLIKTDAIANIGMGTVNKVILVFDGQVLPDEVFRLEMIWDRDNYNSEDVAQNWVRKIPFFEAVAQNALMGWLSGKEAEYIETLSDEEIGETVVAVLKSFLKKSVTKFPNLVKVYKSNWKSSPFTLGSYCHIPVGTSCNEITNLANPVLDSDNKVVLLFAGEATHQTFYSSSHGALLSGKREAQRIIELCQR